MAKISRHAGPTSQELGLLPAEVEEGPAGVTEEELEAAQAPARAEDEKRRKAERDSAEGDDDGAVQGEGAPEGVETASGEKQESTGDAGQPATPKDHRTDQQTDHQAAERHRSTTAGRSGTKAAPTKR